MSCSSCYLVNKPPKTAGKSAYKTAQLRYCPRNDIRRCPPVLLGAWYYCSLARKAWGLTLSGPDIVFSLEKHGVWHCWSLILLSQTKSVGSDIVGAWYCSLARKVWDLTLLGAYIVGSHEKCGVWHCRYARKIVCGRIPWDVNVQDMIFQFRTKVFCPSSVGAVWSLMFEICTRWSLHESCQCALY